MSKYLRIGVSALLLGIIAWRTDWNEVGTKFAHLNVAWWLAAVGVLLAAQSASARRWQLFAHALKFSVSLPRYFAYYLIGMWFNLTLPTSVGGDVVRIWYLSGNSERRMSALASVFLERLNGLVVLIALACVGVVISPAPLPTWIHALVWSIGGAALFGILVMPFLHRWNLMPTDHQEQIRIVLQQVHAPRVLFEATAMSICVQLAGVVCLWCVGVSLGLDLPIAYCCILGPMVSLLTLLPISVNGMGLREQGTIVFLAPLSIGETSATTLAFLWFAVTVAVSLMGGVVYLVGAFPKANTASMEGSAVVDGSPDPATLDMEGKAHGSVDRDTDQGRAGELKKAA